MYDESTGIPFWKLRFDPTFFDWRYSWRKLPRRRLRKKQRRRKQLGRKQRKKEDSASSLMLQNQIAELNRTLDTKLGESSKAIRDQFGESAKIIREITQELVKVGEGQKQVMGVTDQLKNLQDILKNPKQRGVLGEYYLETLLKNVLHPKGFQMQYSFKSGEIVDAVVFVKNQVVPIDAKFSLENYNRMAEEQNMVEKDKLEANKYMYFNC